MPEDNRAYLIHLVRKKPSKLRWELVPVITLCSDIRLLTSGRSWLGAAHLNPSLKIDRP